MKFTVLRSRFLELLSHVQSVVPNKPSLQIISNAMFQASEEGTLTLTATDLDLSVRATLSTDVTVEVPGSTTLPVRKIVEILRMAPEGEVSFDIGEDDVARVITSAAKYRVIGLNTRQFPVIKEPDETNRIFTIDRATFREMLRKTAYAASTDETRRVLTGVCLRFRDNKLTMVATDGKRLSLVEQEMEFPEDSACEMILPPKAVAELSRLLGGEGPMRIVGQAGQIMFDCDSFRFYSKLIEGVYVAYESVIPTSCDERVTVDRNELMSSIQRVAIMSNDKSHAVRLSFADGTLTLLANNTESGEASDVLPIKYAGRALSANYNPNYIMDCIRNLDTDDIIFELNEGTGPAVLKSTGVPFLCVIMPLRIPV